MSDGIKPGTVLHGRYRIVERVGQGGAGAVYRAEDLRLPGRITAVKEIRPDPGETPEMRAQAQDQFRRESNTLARLDHPALPKVSDSFARKDVDFLIMDFVEGPDLREIVDEARAMGEPLDEARVLEWIWQLLEALRYLHGQDPPVLHRDIKPANIKLVEGERIKLVDFGLVKPLDPLDPRTLTVARGVGSLPYTPLEQYAGDTGHTGLQSDIYGVGATLYHLLTGRLPATAQERFLMPNALVRPRRINPTISSRVEATILSAMALHPEKRPGSVGELESMLRGESPFRADSDEGTAPAAWRAAVWENAGLIALVGLLTLLAGLATWNSVRQQAELLESQPAPAVTAPAP